MEEKKVEYTLDVNTILEMKDLKEGKVECGFLHMCQWLSTHSDYEVVNECKLKMSSPIQPGIYAIDNASGDVVSIKDAYCNSRYLYLKEGVCERMDWPLYVTLDLEWILCEFRKEEKWKKENGI